MEQSRPNIFTTKPPSMTSVIVHGKPMLDVVVNNVADESIEETKSNQFSSDFMNDLRSFMNEFAETDLNVDSIEEPGSMTKSQANFYIKLYNQILTEEAEIDELCDSEIKRVNESINLFRAKRKKETESKKEYFVNILKGFAEKELEGKKTKTIKLPYGNLSFKKQQPKVTYQDEDELKKLIKEVQPELLKEEIVEKIDKSALKKAGTIKDGVFYLGDKEVSSISVEILADKFEVK